MEKLLSLKEYPDFVKFHLPALLWMVFIFALSSVPGSTLAAIEFPYAHLIAHTLLYAMLYYLLYRALGHERFSAFLRRHRIGGALIIVALWGASDEYHQAFTRENAGSEGFSDRCCCRSGCVGCGCPHKSRQQRSKGKSGHDLSSRCAMALTEINSDD